MKKSTKALVALLMSLVMITTLILPNYISSGAEGSKAGYLATPGDAELSLASVEQLSVSNLKLEKKVSSNPETWSNVQTGESIPNGTDIRLSFDWEVDNTANQVTEDIVVSYDLNLFGFKLQNITTGKVYFSDSTGKQMGTYTIVDGVFTVTIDKDYYNANSEKKGKATLIGNIDVEQTGNEENKETTLSASGQTWPIIITYDKKESVVSVSKTLDGDLTKTSDGNYIQPYTVTVNCQYDQITNLELTDTHGNAITSLGSFEYNGQSYNSLAEVVAAATNNGIMDAGESFTFTYNAVVSKECYAQETNDNDRSNTLTATYKSNTDGPNENSSSSSTAKISVNKPNVNKTGALSQDGTEVTWTITIDCGDFTWDDVDLSNAIDTYTEEIAGGTTLTKTFTKDDFTTSDNRYYSATYTTKISDTALDSVTPVNLKNKYENVNVDGNNYSGSAGITTNGASFVNKECVDHYKDSDGNTILVWETSLDIPDTEITDFNISDTVPWSWNSTHVFSGYNNFTSTISINGTDVFTWENGGLKLLDNNNEIVTKNYYGSSNSFSIYLTDSFVDANKNKKVVLRYETIVNSGPTAGKTFSNSAKVEYKESPKPFEDTGSWTDNSINILSKWGTVDENEDTVQYAVRAYFKDMGDDLKPGTLTLSDVFSNDYMEIVSVDEAYICTTLSEYYASQDTDITNDITMSKNDNGSVTFTTNLTQSQCDVMRENGGLLLRYTARIKDPLNTTQKISFTNTITGDLDGVSIGEQSTTNELTPNDMVTKAVAEYSADTAPNMKFTINVNPTAADLVDGDTITAVDTMGSKLIFTSDNKIEVTNTKTGENVPFTYEYDQPNGTITFYLPDEISLNITYTAKLTTIATDKQNPTNNEQLTFENSGNTFSLEGKTSDDTKEYYDEQRFSYVPNVSGTGTVSSLTLYKYFTKPNGSSAVLGGSTFEVYETIKNGDGTYSINENKLVARETMGEGVNEWQIKDLLLDTVYALKETGAANGFKVNDDILYFAIPGSNFSSLPDSVKTFAGNSVYNYKNEYNTGNLKISKTLAGSALTAEDSNVEFEFTITLTGTADSGITAEEVTATYSDVEFVGGVATIKLKGGESKTISGLPQGLSYSVTETDVDGFTPSSTGATGTIGNATTKTAAFTNTKGEVATVDITVTKVWEDDNNKYNTRPTSIKVQLYADNDAVAGEKITLSAGNNWTYNWTKLPEEVSGAKINYTVEEAEDVKGYTSETTGSAADGYIITNTLNKQYEDGEVTFKIQKYATGTTTPVAGAVFSITDKDGAKTTATTDGNGIASFTVQPSGDADIVYTLAEDSTPEGYQKTDDTWTVTVKKDGTVTIKDQNANPLVLVYNWIAEIANLNKDANGNYVVYNDEIANLVITKTIKGDVTKEEAEGAISFTVTNSDGSYTKTIKLTDEGVTYDAGTNKYTITLNDIPVGTYTVEETTKDIAGNSVTVKYSVNGGSQEAGDTASNISLTGGNTTNVDFENDYSEDKGSLKIVKTTNGGTTPGTAEFTIEGPNGYSKTVTYSEFTNGEYLIADLALGTYTVTESVDSAKVDGYSLKVTGNGSTATVVKDGTATVTLTNDYSEDKGSLKIVKTTVGGTTPGTAEFTIEGPNDYSKTVTYGEFTNGEYLIADLALGTYTVTESVDSAKVDGYSLTVTGNGSTVTVVKNDTASVELTNTYSEDKGSLKIVKTTVGGTTPGTAEFTIEGPNGYSKTVTYSEFTSGEYLIADLALGTYTVTESVDSAKVDGYSLKVTGNGSTAVVVNDTESTVELTNTYTPYEYEDGEVTFKIQKYATGTTTPVVGAVFSITDKNGTKTTATTDGNGIASFTVQPSGDADIVYTLAEDFAPEGYKKTDDTWTVTVKKDGTVTIKDQNANPLVLVYNWIAEIANLNKDANGNYVVYNDEIANLVITKTIKGDVTKEEAEGAISFTVTNSDGSYTKTIKLTDEGVTYDAGTNKYTITLNDIPVGTYTVEETTKDIAGNSVTVKYSVNGGSQQAGDTASNIGLTGGNTTNVDFENDYSEDKGSLKIVKKTNGGTTPDGAEFTIEGPNGYSKTVTYGEFTNGEYLIADLALGTYTVTESVDSAKVDGYSLTVTGNGSTATVVKDGTATVTLTNDYSEDKGNLVITKTIKGDVTKEEAEGAISFTVTNSDGSYEKTIRLTDEGVTYDAGTNQYTITLNDIPVGTYTVEETTKDIAGNSVTVKYSVNGGSQKTGDTASNIGITDGNTSNVDFENDYSANTGKIRFTKVAFYKETCAKNSDDTKPLEGVTFTLYEKNDTAFANPLATATSDNNGIVEFTDVPYGTYAIKETAAKAGYIAIDDVFTATIDASNASTYAKLDGVKNNEVVNDVVRTDISLVKVNESNTDEKLPNSTYALYAKDGAVESVIAEATTNVNGVLKFEGVFVDKEYTIKEISAPDGSYVSESPITISYELDSNGNVVIKSFDGGVSTLSGMVTAYVDENGNITWLEPSVLYSFDKVDEDGNPLSGATLRLLDADGNQIDEWVTDGNSHEVNGILTVGKTYTLHEVSAPEGYELADDVIFTVSDDKVGAGENTVVTITMVDKKTEPTTDEPTTDEPTTDEPTTDEPTTDEPTTTTETTTQTTEDKPDKPDGPKTGDEAPIVPAAVILFVSLAACGILVVRKRKDER